MCLPLLVFGESFSLLCFTNPDLLARPVTFALVITEICNENVHMQSIFVKTKSTIQFFSVIASNYFQSVMQIEA